MNLESAVLVLRSANATSNILGSNMTWNAVNFRQLLGTLYDKYDKFKICLTSVSNFNANAIAVVADRFVSCEMTGLNFINSTFEYQVGNGGMLTNKTTLCPVDLVGTTNQGRSINLTGEFGQVFYIDNPNVVDINISLLRIMDGTLNGAQDYGNWVFVFSIYGVTDFEEEE